MKRIIAFGLVLLLASCGGNPTPKKTWDDVYKMIDADTTQSVIERSVQEIGVQNHPASMTILRYFDYFMTGEGLKAWEYIDKESPLAKEIGNEKILQERINSALKENQYKGVLIKGLTLSKPDDKGDRLATIRFVIYVYDKNTMKDYESIANYIVKGKNEKWLIYDIIKSQIGIK
jgi:hypothetical protein